VKKRQREPVVTGAEIRRRLGIVDRTMSRWFAAGLPVVSRDHSGRNPRVKLWDLAKWLHDKDAGIDDPDLTHGGGTSANLEKYRKEKARQAKRENDAAEGRLVEVEDVYRIQGEVFGAMGRELEAVERLHGLAVGQAIREALARAQDSGKKGGLIS